MILNGFDTEEKFDYENGFHATSTIDRFGKILAHYELYKKIIELPGNIVECGIFKGNSLFRFLAFRDLLESPYSRKVIGFDIFGSFPMTEHEEDKRYLQHFIDSAGENSIELSEIEKICRYKKNENVSFIKGDINLTVPSYIEHNPHTKIALLHIDTDVYEPAMTILNHLYDSVVKGGIIMFDDYGTFPGETKAVDNFFKDKGNMIRKLPISHIPSYIIKE